MPRTSEVAFNSLFAEALRGKHPLWRDHLRVEQSGVFPGSPKLRPDLLVQGPDTQRVGERTSRMALTIIAYALAVHAAIAGRRDIPPVPLLRTESRTFFQFGVLDAWNLILRDINYWPIFKVASDLLCHMCADTSRRVLAALGEAAERLAGIGATTRHDLSDRMFQNMIVDQKFLATFYTMPCGAGREEERLRGTAIGSLDLAHAKVKPGGVAALALPMAAVQGGS